MSIAHYAGRFETSGPLVSPYLSGDISAWVTEVGGVDPVTIIRADQDFQVHVHWTLKGHLTEFVCGYWCVSVFLESIGPGKEIRYPEPPLEIKLTPRPGDVDYAVWVQIPANTLDIADCSTPYKLAATVTYLTELRNPGPMAGFVEGPLLQFYIP